MNDLPENCLFPGDYFEYVLCGFCKLQTKFIMKRIMQPRRILNRFFFIMMISALFTGCRDIIIEEEPDDSLVLKNGMVTVPMTGTLEGGALYEIALPMAWNYLPKRYLIVYAHGYRDFNLSLALPTDIIAPGLTIKDLILSSNLGYAATSYRSNGLCVLEGIEDIVLLRQTVTEFFNPLNPANPGYLPPHAVILSGPSEGGMVTILTIERYPGLFDAAIATCCPTGSLYAQMQHFGDAHVLFKYFFGESLNDINLGSPKGISKATINAWVDGSLKTAILEAIANDYLNNGGNNVRQFLACAKIPADVTNPAAVATTILEVMKYPIMASNDILARMGGNPYNNKYPERQYTGSDNDRKLNLTVERICRSDWEEGKQTVDMYYETSGKLFTPLVNMHTTGDHISLFAHQQWYKEKVELNSPMPGLLKTVPVERYGHCTFTPEEILGALMLLIPQ